MKFLVVLTVLLCAAAACYAKMTAPNCEVTHSERDFNGKKRNDISPTALLDVDEPSPSKIQVVPSLKVSLPYLRNAIRECVINWIRWCTWVSSTSWSSTVVPTPETSTADETSLRN